jgi:hypothetical protein
MIKRSPNFDVASRGSCVNLWIPINFLPDISDLPLAWLSKLRGLLILCPKVIEVSDCVWYLHCLQPHLLSFCYISLLAEVLTTSG